MDPASYQPPINTPMLFTTAAFSDFEGVRNLFIRNHWAKTATDFVRSRKPE